MRRNLLTLLAVVVVGGGLLPLLFVTSKAWGQADSDRSWPKDTTVYSRPAVPEDLAPGGKGAVSSLPALFITDVAVAAGTNGGTEPSIAVDPADPDHIVIHAGFGGWNGNDFVWESTNGGVTWTQRFSIPPPPGGVGTAGCPCDTTVDYGRSDLLSGTFLTCVSDGMGGCTTTDVYSGTTANPASAAAWNWFTPMMGITQMTNNALPGNADQPWLMVNRDPTTAAQDNVYVAYDDFGSDPRGMRVAVSYGANPPNFTVDNASGNAPSGVNPGHRLAVDPRTGFVYSLFQRCVANCGGDPKNIDYTLNRSTDGGATWPLGGGSGITVANADSTQPTPKFGTVNALLGGVTHGAVDPNTGDIYYVYGNRDGAGNNRLAIRRIFGDGMGGLTVGAENFVTGQVQAAVPSVAVKDDGTVGVFYYTFDGFSSDDFPIFTAHLALSDDQGGAFTDISLLTFLSAATDNGNAKQRVLGDYVQLKAVGNCLYGVFTGNGVPFGRTMAQHDPIFYKVCQGPRISLNPAQLDFGLVPVDPVGSESGIKSLDFNICNVGTSDLVVQDVTLPVPNPAFSIIPPPPGGFPLPVSPDFCHTIEVRCDPVASGLTTATAQITSNDPDNPVVSFPLRCTGTVGDIRVTGSTEFGEVCAGTQAEQRVSVCNVGPSNLDVTGASLSCGDFTIINNPFPAVVSPDSCVDLTVRFTPTSAGEKTCDLVITSSDPDEPSVTLVVHGTTPAGSIDVAGDQGFLPEVIQTVGPCTTAKPFPISNTGKCNLKITNITIGGTNADDFALSGLPSFPIILEPGHLAGEGDLETVFAPTDLDRDRLGTLTVTYESDPVSGATMNEVRDLCGEGVFTGARVLVRAGGLPLDVVKQIHLQRINANRNKIRLDTSDVAKNLPLQTVIPAPPCGSFQFHREYGTVSNPIQLLPGAYQVTATAIVNGKQAKKTVGFDVGTCDFNPMVIIDF
jgi:hypothetical protein